VERTRAIFLDSGEGKIALDGTRQARNADNIKQCDILTQIFGTDPGEKAEERRRGEKEEKKKVWSVVEERLKET
jgi:hypothetical protein